MKRLAAIILLLTSGVIAAEQAAYRIELRGQSPVLSKDQPVPRGSVLVFHRYPDGVLTSVPREQILEVVPLPSSEPQPARAVPSSTESAVENAASVKGEGAVAPRSEASAISGEVAAAPPPSEPAALASASTSSAPQRPYVPGRIVREQISLSDAVRLTLDNDPNLRFSREQAFELEGTAREASGAFDPFMTFDPSYQHREGRVIGVLLNREINRRKVHQLLADTFEQIANDLQQKLNAGFGRVFPDCGDTDIRFENKAICSSLLNQARDLAFDKLLETLIANEPDPAIRQEYERIRASANDPLRAQLVRFVSTLRDIIANERDALAKLGELPKFEVRDTLDFDLRLHVPFRNGMTIAPVFFLEGVKDNFRNKPSDPIFGGLGLPNLFTAVGGFTVDASLAKGGSATSVAAPERAAKLNFQAALDSYAQAGSLAILKTVLAYWDLVAAQDQLALLRRSLKAQGQIEDIGQALVKGDEIPRAELDRVRARTADAASAVAQGQQAVTTARVALATAMGLAVEDLENAPFASDPLPGTEGVAAFESIPTATLAREAVEARSDVKAARQLREAAETLLRAARYDLKPRVDLSFQFAYNAIYQSLRTDYWQPVGYGRALGGRWVGPSFEIVVRFQIPPANNAARGRLEQSLALRNRSEVSLRDLERTVRSNTVTFAEAVRKAAAEISQRKDSIRYYEETIQAAVERFRAGEASLLDTILTERSVTGALLDLVSAKQSFARRMTRLRFEMGSLVQLTREGSAVTFGAVQPTGFPPR